MAEPRLRYGRIGTPEGVVVEDEHGIGALRVAGGAASGRMLDDGGAIYNLAHPKWGIPFGGGANGSPALQAALLSIAAQGGGVAMFPQRSALRLDYTGSISAGSPGNTSSWRYCVLIPENVTVDLNGSTVQLGNGQHAALFMNAGAGGLYRDDRVGLRNGVLYGNRGLQGSGPSAMYPLVAMYNVRAPLVEDLDAEEAVQRFGLFRMCFDGLFRNLHGIGSNGNGWDWGVTDQEVFDCYIDDISGTDCEFTDASNPGNPVFIHGVRCRVGEIGGRSCTYGVKIGGDHTRHVADTYVERAWYIGGGRSISQGIKIQGTSSERRAVGVTIGEAVSEGAESEGLYVIYADDSVVTTYRGINNAQGVELKRDIYVGTSSRVGGTSWTSRGAGGLGCVIAADAEEYDIGSVMIENCTGLALQLNSNHGGRIGTLIAKDNRPSPAMTRALEVNGAGAGKIDEVRTNLPSDDAARVRLPQIAAAFRVGAFIEGSTPMQGVVQLNQGASETSVPGTSGLWQAAVGGGTYTAPIVEVRPWNASAAGLGPLRYRVTAYQSGGGLWIRHPSAGANDLVHWRVVGWQNVSAPPT